MSQIGEHLWSESKRIRNKYCKRNSEEKRVFQPRGSLIEEGQKFSAQNTAIEAVCGEDRLEAAQSSPCPKSLELTAHARIKHVKCCGDDRRLYQVNLSAHEDNAYAVPQVSLVQRQTEFCYLYQDGAWKSLGRSQGLRTRTAKGRPCSREFSETSRVGETSRVEGKGDSVKEIRG